MKKICSFIVLFFAVFTMNAQQENIVKIDPKIEEATVYLNGAEIRHSKDIKLTKGRNKIIFQNLSLCLQPKSIQASILGDIEIISVTSKNDFFNAEKSELKVKKFKDSTEQLNEKITALTNQLEAYKAEGEVLTKNQYLGSTQSGVNVLELQKAADFYRERTLLIKNSMSKLKKQLEQLNEKLVISETQLNEITYQVNPERKEVTIVAVAPSDLTTTVKIRYLVTEAGWTPSYDLIATDITKPIQLKYKAQVFNSTGIDWENVKFKLSTADPSLGASKPYLTPWNLNYNSEANEGIIDRKAVGEYDKVTTDAEVQYASVAVEELNTEFVIEKPYDIASDSKPYQVDITTYSLTATYEHLAIPKVDRDVFLIAKISGWEKYNLISGMANVYFGDTYIGESLIDTRNVDDTLDLSLGRDNQVLVTKTKKEDYGSKNLIGTSRKESFIYEIIAKNNRTVPVTINITDQIPISQESDITVEIEQISGAIKDELSGKLEWITKLNPGESVKYNLSFYVKYPKNKKVNIRKSRAMNMRMF